MASKTTLNAKNLEALGAERLAELLIEVSTGNAAAKRKLRLALAGAQSPKEAAREITKRLTSISRARAFVNWKKKKALVDDLETQRRAILEQVAPDDPQEALQLLWRFMGLATSVFDRCDDSSGAVIGVFHEAREDLDELAVTAQADVNALAEAMGDLDRHRHAVEDHDLMAPVELVCLARVEAQRSIGAGRRFLRHLRPTGRVPSVGGRALTGSEWSDSCL